MISHYGYIYYFFLLINLFIFASICLIYLFEFPLITLYLLFIEFLFCSELLSNFVLLFAIIFEFVFEFKIFIQLNKEVN